MINQYPSGLGAGQGSSPMGPRPMNQEVDPRHPEIIAELSDLDKLTGVLKERVLMLNDRLSTVMSNGGIENNGTVPVPSRSCPIAQQLLARNLTLTEILDIIMNINARLEI